MKKIIILILSALIIAGCSQAENTNNTTYTEAQSTTAEAMLETAPETETHQDTESESAQEEDPDVEVTEVTEVTEAIEIVESIPDLSGEWIESGYEEADTYMIASIEDDVIEINWYMGGRETIALYWAGTYTAPTEPGDFTWDSVNDKGRTDFALLASGDDTKTFTYNSDADEITYSQSAMGVTTTVHLIRTANK